MSVSQNIDVRPRIYLMGFMGSGKSSEGKKMARRLGYQFVETDRLIEERLAKTVPQIFETLGESEFRKLELQVLKESQIFTRTVIALGGGTPCSEEAWKYLGSPAFTLWLKVPPGHLIQRLRQKPANRPLVQQLSDEELMELYHRREPFYRRAQQWFVG